MQKERYKDMKTKRREIKNQEWQQIATGMIVSDRFLREIRNIYDPKLVSIPFIKTVANWCIDYYKQFQSAPRQHIQDIYNYNARNNLDEDQAEMIGDFLATISSEHERSDKINVPYLLDQAEKQFKSSSLQILSEDVKAHLSNSNIAEAEACLSKYKRVELPTSSGLNPFTNKEAIITAFDNDSERLFALPGALGQLMNDQLVREGFIGIMGPEKRGKTFMLMELAKRAAKARCNVAFIGAGDMTQDPMVVRWHVSLAAKSNKEKYCGDLLIPVLDCVHNQTNNCRKSCRTSTCGIGIESEKETIPFNEAPKSYCPCSVCDKLSQSRFRGAVWYERKNIPSVLTWREGLRHGRQFMKRLKGRDFKLACYPSRSINVQDIKTQLDIWEHFEGFTPDVVVIDYADILAPESTSKGEFRHEQNETWIAMRALSQERRCLVITATQADAASYEAINLRPKNFSEDKRKYGHVTGMLGLNQTDEDKRRGIMRINWLVLREGEYKVTHMVKILQCLQIGKPMIASYW